MPRALITGSTGTIGSALVKLLEQQGWEIFAWDRKVVPIDDYYKMENFIKLIRPDVLFHLAYTTDSNQSWFVNYEWTSELAWLTRILHIKFVFTSTNLVFSHNKQGPFMQHSIPDAHEGYGFEKRKSEERIMQQNPHAIIARLGWQISPEGGSNNMINFFHKKLNGKNAVRCSTQWVPACSFLEDTCRKLLDLATIFPSGIYMLDSNQQWSMFEIASALTKKYGYGWKVEPVNDFGWNSRMIDERMNMPSLQTKLPHLHD